MFLTNNYQLSIIKYELLIVFSNYRGVHGRGAWLVRVSPIDSPLCRRIYCRPGRKALLQYSSASDKLDRWNNSGGKPCLSPFAQGPTDWFLRGSRRISSRNACKYKPTKNLIKHRNRILKLCGNCESCFALKSLQTEDWDLRVSCLNLFRFTPPV